MQSFRHTAVAGMALTVGVMGGCPQNAPRGMPAPAASAASVRTDLAGLQPQLTLPPGVRATRWTFGRDEDASGVPSPGSATLVGRLELSGEAMKQLLARGTWTAEPIFPAGLRTVQHPDPAPTTLQRSRDPEPGASVIRGGTWMTIELCADPQRNVLFFIAGKS